MMLSSENEHDQWYTCPRCGKRSYNPQDVAERYCGHCHTFGGGPVDETDELSTEASQGLRRALERGSEPFWMQDIRLAGKRIQAARERARRARSQGEG